MINISSCESHLAVRTHRYDPRIPSAQRVFSHECESFLANNESRVGRNAIRIVSHTYKSGGCILQQLRSSATNKE